MINKSFFRNFSYNYIVYYELNRMEGYLSVLISQNWRAAPAKAILKHCVNNAEYLERFSCEYCHDEFFQKISKLSYFCFFT